MTGSFWGAVLYWVLVSGLLLIFVILLLTIKDTWASLKIIRNPVTGIQGPGQPFCARVEVELKEEPLTSPLLQKPCLYYSSEITKHYSSKHAKKYYEDTQQADYRMHSGNLTFLPPEKEKANYVKPVYQLHKGFLQGSLPGFLESNLRQLPLEESFWKKLKTTSIDFDEGLFEPVTHLWVVGCLQTDEDNPDKPLRLSGPQKDVPPLLCGSYEQLKKNARYQLISHTTITLNFSIFSLVAAYVLF